MSSLRLSGITKSFGTVEVLTGIDLEIEHGSFVCLLGGSGCGKTTLLRIIAGFETPNAGSLTLDGQSLTEVPSHQRNIGMVFQSLALFPHLSVADNIAYGLSVRGIDKAGRTQKVDELLSLVDLNGMGHRRVSALSGGQKQRVAIARALAIEPGLFLMDEPFSALDAGLREHLQKEIKQLQQRLGVTTIFVTHDQQEAMTLADKVVVMNEGRLEQIGSPAEIYHRPQTRYVADFIGQNNVLDLRVEGGTAQWKGNSLGAAPAGWAAETCIALRPEAIALSEPGQGLSGEVTFVRRLGAVVETHVQIEGETLIQTGLSGGAVPTVGETVGLSLDLAQAWVIPA